MTTDDTTPPPVVAPEDFDPLAVADSVRRHGAPADHDAVLAAIYAEN